MNNQEFDAIMKQITSGLTGDPEKDIPYLHAQCEIFKDHEWGKEIMRACGRLIYEALPEEMKKEIDIASNNDAFGTQATLEEVRFNLHEGDLEKAKNLIEGLVEKIEDMAMFDNDEVSAYFTFGEPFEEILYRLTAKPKKQVRRAPIPYSEIYYLYGYLLIEFARYEEAKKALENAMRWNPSNAGIAFEYAEIFKIQGDLEKTEALTKEIIKIAFRPSDLARVYRNLGYIYIEKKMLREAIACYYLSMQYDTDAKNAQSELFYIHTNYDENIDPPSKEEMRDISERCELPIGADDDIVGIAYSIGKHKLDERDYDMAEYLLQIAYDLTGDDDIAKLLTFIPKADNRLS